MKITRKQLENSIWGFILGDCLGVPYEFRKKGTFKYKKFAGYGTYNQPPGTWSDDTSLMLCLIDSYEDGEFNIGKHKANLTNFLKYGHYTADGIFDIGNATRNAISSNFTNNTNNEYGNGSLLRCWLLLALSEEKCDFVKFIRLTHSFSETTDLCCHHYSKLYHSIATHEDLRKGMFSIQEFNNLIFTNQDLCIEGTIIDVLNKAVEAIYNRYTFKEVIEMGGDTDSNAAIFGSLYYINKEVFINDKKKIRHSEYLNEIISCFLDKIYL